MTVVHIRGPFFVTDKGIGLLAEWWKPWTWAWYTMASNQESRPDGR